MFDKDIARSQYNPENGEYKLDAMPFAAYSPAYIVSNEDLRAAMTVLQPRGANVLTVAGSGDQPLFYKLYGANAVDTFDVSLCAKAMMDIKTAIIANKPRAVYVNVLREFNKNPVVANTPAFRDVQAICPRDSRNFVQNMAGCKICRVGGLYADSVPFDSEYDILAKNVRGPFNFHWVGLDSVVGRLNQSYDQIYLSNILQYKCDFEYVFGLVNSLRPFLNPNGKIMLQVSAYFIGDELKVFNKLKDAVSAWARVNIMRGKAQDMCVLQVR